MTQPTQSPRHRTRLHLRPLPAAPTRRAAVLQGNLGQILNALQTLHRDCLDVRDATAALTLSLYAHTSRLTTSESVTDELLVGLHGAVARFQRELNRWSSALQQQVDGLHSRAGDASAPLTSLAAADDDGNTVSAG